MKQSDSRHPGCSNSFNHCRDIGRSRIFLSTLIIAFAMSTSFVLRAFAETRAKGYLKIYQESKLVGEVETLINSQAMKVSFKKSRTFLICKAPDWTVYKYNQTTKKYCIWPYSNFHNKLSETRALMGAPTNTDVLLHKIGEKTFLQYDANIYKSSDEYYKKVQAMYEAHEITGNYPSTMEMTTLVTLNCVPQEAHIMSIALAVPQTKELPVTAKGWGCDGKTYLYLTTPKIEALTSAADWLLPPANFTKVNDETKLMADEQLNANILDLIHR